MFVCLEFFPEPSSQVRLYRLQQSISLGRLLQFLGWQGKSEDSTGGREAWELDVHSSKTQRLQNLLIKEYTINLIRVLIVI